MDKDNKEPQGVFINGKAQIVEMLQFMTPDEKNKLLANIRMRNPILAGELSVESLTFAQVGKLNSHELNILFKYIAAPILGVALKGASQELQKKLLSSSPRSYAEEAYKIMITPLSNEKRDIGRAQTKILNILGALSKRKQINLQ